MGLPVAALARRYTGAGSCFAPRATTASQLSGKGRWSALASLTDFAKIRNRKAYRARFDLHNAVSSSEEAPLGQSHLKQKISPGYSGAVNQPGICDLFRCAFLTENTGWRGQAIQHWSIL